MYDAGDTIKFGFPMAYTASVLSWAILEYGDQMEVAKQLEPAQDSLKWIMDFLVNAHPSPNVLYIQVGDPKSDHKCWEKPESITKARPLIQVNTSAPGTEVAAETSAAMAAASLVFKSSDSDYSALLLKHAKELFAFAEKHRASYSKSIPQVAAYYNSTGYGDELLWAATWLYHATGDETYYDFATGDDADEFVQWGSPTWFSWDDKFPGAQADYVLGDNPMEMSYLVGYGDKYPEYVHHRGASIPAKAKPGCKQGFKWLDSSKPNPNVAVGALVGGPFLNDTYVDARNNSMQGEPTTYNSALLVGLLSGLVTTSSVVKSFV
nr:endoglucanase 2-like [Ipomoea batatas]